MIKAFFCKCGDHTFEILTETDRFKNTKKTYFRCSECGEDYELNEVNFSLKDDKHEI